MDDRIIGIIGGGQLGRMMTQACHRLGIRTACLDPSGTSSPCGQICDLSVEGSLQDSTKYEELASVSDLLTVEVEHVDCDALRSLHSTGVIVHPDEATIRMIQDKYIQKKFFEVHGIPLPDFIEVPSIESAKNVGEQFGYPFMLKSRKFAYDGKGNVVVNNKEELAEAFSMLLKNNSKVSGRKMNPKEINSKETKTFVNDEYDNRNYDSASIYAEKWVPLQKELAMMVVRSKDDIITYPVVETTQKNSICHSVLAPAQISEKTQSLVSSLITKCFSHITGIGIYGVEFFLLQDGSILFNEIAPRPHNSGHYTMECFNIDQFEMHIRAILDLPCPKPVMKCRFAMMINVIGEGNDMDNTKEIMVNALSVPDAAVHWYAKKESRLGRKMGHITVTAESLQSLFDRVQIISERDSFILRPYINELQTVVVVQSKHEKINYDNNEKEKEMEDNQCMSNPRSASPPRISIIMGSDSDLIYMRDAASLLDTYKVPYELTIVSAHRTPTRMYSYAQNAVERGIECIIAGAGGAAHLPGMIASLTTLPVIGVPIKTTVFSGNDSLLSIVQMPTGVPVATVAIGNATNAALLALRMLAIKDKLIMKSLQSFHTSQEEEVLKKAIKLESIGHDNYLETNMKR